ncbi:hypothetical protein ANCCEY_09242 [Ancylostoma ceylanicum]|uniref:Myosin tail domain-containing protein n=1 Tax=Ancylostoma ceylanicum TaxID=53326 RepID=A0A0D6LVK3_9BILA|nr:hypothetical protein ANCCEY_09242 [Ancylostoma ceylanicum]
MVLQLEKSKNALLNSLRADLAKAETEIKEALAREDALRAEVNEAKEEVKELLQRLEKEKSDKAEQQSRLRERDESKERNRLNFTAQLEESQVKLVKSAAQLEEANRKKQSLEGEITKLETALARKTTSMKELEQKIDGLMERLRASEIQEQKYRDQMAVLEKVRF